MSPQKPRWAGHIMARCLSCAPERAHWVSGGQVDDPDVEKEDGVPATAAGDSVTAPCAQDTPKTKEKQKNKLLDTVYIRKSKTPCTLVFPVDFALIRQRKREIDWENQGAWCFAFPYIYSVQSSRFYDICI